MNSKKLYIFRFTHIDNIPHILKHGITHINSQNSNTKYVQIGDPSLISTRNSEKIPLNNEALGDYTPFYFCVRSPMLYVVQKGYNDVPAQRSHNIVYIVSSIQSVIQHKLDFIYTDGHATNNFTTFYDQTNLNQIKQHLDLEAINAKYWIDQEDLDLKRRKQAEFLIKEDLPNSAILGFVVDSEYSYNKLINMNIPDKKISIRKNFYF